MKNNVSCRELQVKEENKAHGLKIRIWKIVKYRADTRTDGPKTPHVTNH
jgi:hypothetical protein